MTREEFVELHGEQLWENLVLPTQRLSNDVLRNNVNAVIHHDVLMPLLRKIAPYAKGLEGIKTN